MPSLSLSDSNSTRHVRTKKTPPPLSKRATSTVRTASGAALVVPTRQTLADYQPTTCQFIKGDAKERRTKGDAIFCGAPVVRGESYCSECLKRCIATPSKDEG